MKKIGVLLLVLGFLLIGCSRDSSSTTTDSTNVSTSTEGNAVIEVVDVVKSMTGTSPTVLIVYENSGSETAYALSCVVAAMKDDSVLEQVTADVSERLPSLILAEGENSAVEFSFSNFTSHDAYESLRIDFTWQEAYSGRVEYRYISSGL